MESIKHLVMHMSTPNAQEGEEDLAFGAFFDAFREQGLQLPEVSEEIAEYLLFSRHLSEYGDSQAAFEYAREQITSVRTGSGA